MLVIFILPHSYLDAILLSRCFSFGSSDHSHDSWAECFKEAMADVKFSCDFAKITLIFTLNF